MTEVRAGGLLLLTDAGAHRVRTGGIVALTDAGAHRVRTGGIVVLVDATKPTSVATLLVLVDASVAPRPALRLQKTAWTLIFQRRPGEVDWTLLQQCKAFTPEIVADERAAGRAGERARTRRGGSAKTTLTIATYVEAALTETARLAGLVLRPGGGWTGSEVIGLDTTAAADFKIENYDSDRADARLVATEYITEFRPSGLKIILGAETGARVALLQGTARSYAIRPEATP